MDHRPPHEQTSSDATRNANCGASFEWVGRAINPYLGFLTGWLMMPGYLIGTVPDVVVLGPSVLAVFAAHPAGPWA